MLDVMRTKGIFPNLLTYNTLISGLLLLRRLDEAIELFNNMKCLGVEPTAYTYVLFIDYYGKYGDPGKTLDTYVKMNSKGNCAKYSSL
ncbi:hypothetical protein QN277_009642 [Acacia crassicarpa]|uniref:Pentatricopeptide repeat-containing protein n=1 Tax=Acacia crassicarpa TaxID=499986 RepID=A0AAE1IPS2_9FABA|nr:hypothetical protein QN277_009642 [Acacia crassicarpa]